MTIEQIIAAELKVKPQQVHAALELLDGGNTIPFIARYRKEATGTLDEEALRSIEERAKPNTCASWKNAVRKYLPPLKRRKN